MKKTVWLLAFVFAVVACGDDSDAFYTTRYDIVRSKVRVITQLLVEPDNPDKENAIGSDAFARVDPTDLVGDGAIVRDFELPAGGSYLLEYTRYDGGILTVRPSSEAGSVSVGEFDKQPAARSMTFRYDGQEFVYALDTYTDETTGIPYVMLTTDLTAYYEELYPDDYIVEVKRMEITSTPE